MQNLFIQLRKCCNHPALFCLGKERGGIGYPSFSSSSALSFNQPPSPSSFLPLSAAGDDRKEQKEDEMFDAASLLRDSTKFRALNVILDFYLKRQEKIVIFSFSTMMLDLVEDFLDERGVSTARLDGRMSDEERRTALNAFLSTVHNAVFLFLPSCSFCSSAFFVSPDTCTTTSVHTRQQESPPHACDTWISMPACIPRHQRTYIR